ncbi:MAG: 16S rRNA (uracil(1498)-N(3))-methyltransferase [Vampirovibrionales bacterium]|nr:16S rRNA (uracil(1498)-N(3))-methyltransferase [Vampirovibrionales bacterium]
MTAGESSPAFDAMRVSRFFLPFPAPVDALPARILVTQEDVVHKLAHVLRLRAGDPLLAIDGEREVAYEATVDAIGRDQATISLWRPYARAVETPIALTLGAALIKGQRWDWLLQKATELGCRRLLPIESERSIPHIGSPQKKRERWEAVARAAAEQSEGLFLPEIAPPMALPVFCDAVRGASLKIALEARAVSCEGPADDLREPLRLLLRKHAHAKSAVLAVGPEGGWTAQELDSLRVSGFRFASLGERVLRSETAALTALAALIYEFC